jgi:hypothetical protein
VVCVNLCSILICILALPAGEQRKKVSELTGEISAQWQVMSKAERTAATEAGKKDLESHREMKALASRNMATHAFHDAHRTIDSLKKEVYCTSIL